VTIAKEEARAAKQAATEAASSEDARLSVHGNGNGMVILELWKPAGGAISFWEAAGVEFVLIQLSWNIQYTDWRSKSSFHPPALIRTALEEYLTKHSLVDPHDDSLALLDAELGRAVGQKRPDPGGRMVRSEIVEKLRAGVTWGVSINGSVKWVTGWNFNCVLCQCVALWLTNGRKGSLQPISMVVKTRQSRKTVTLISGLEAFGINVEEFADEMKRLCAGSASGQSLGAGQWH
jgi:translation initiation factor 2D